MSFKAEVSYKAPRRELEAALRALMPEAQSQPSGRMVITLKGERLVLRLEAKSFSIIRAMLASIVRMIRCFSRVAE